ncbi:MAG: ParB/RepB/Spo0J family partition protein [Pseudomonadota bacterium]
MADKPNKRGLGRGLSALMSDVAETSSNVEDAPKSPDRTVPIELIEPNPDQPRRDFEQKALDDLAASIREKGVIQPLIVRRNPRRDGAYEIVAGERRWRASQLAKLHEVPVIIREFSDEEVLEVAIIENIQRADLNPIEEAFGYTQLMEKFGHTQEKLAIALSKSRSHVANAMRLLSLPVEVQAFLRDGSLSAGHARALITSENPLALAKDVIRRGLSVRDTEKLAKGSSDKADAKLARASTTGEKDADTQALEADLAANLKMSVSLDHKAGGEGGRLTISYKSFDQLDDLCRRLTSNH